MRTCDLYMLWQAQTWERREMGRPLMRGDLLRLGNGRFVEVVHAGNAGDCAEAFIEGEILALRRERRGQERL